MLARPGAPEEQERLRLESLAEIGLYDLDCASVLWRSDLAARLTADSTVTMGKTEQDARPPTVRNYIEALGGTLEVRAVFEDRAVTLALCDSDEGEP